MALPFMFGCFNPFLSIAVPIAKKPSVTSVNFGVNLSFSTFQLRRQVIR